MAETDKTLDTSAIEALGYTVERNEGDNAADAPYRLIGKRGARYLLLRNRVTPHLLFAINDTPGYFGTVTVRGYTWFSDKDGKLRPTR